MFVPPISVIRRKKIIKRLIIAGAVTPETAITLDEAGIFNGIGLIIYRLEDHGILIKVNNDRYYVDVTKC